MKNNVYEDSLREELPKLIVLLTESNLILTNLSTRHLPTLTRHIILRSAIYTTNAAVCVRSVLSIVANKQH